jgi:hypothetical protein
MASTTVFIAHAKEDEGSRNLFTVDAVGSQTPFEFDDMLAEEPCTNEWKAWARARIKRSSGVIAMLSPSTPGSAAEIWAIQCAFLEGKPLLGVWMGDYSVRPEQIKNAPCVIWTWPNIAAFVERLQPVHH